MNKINNKMKIKNVKNKIIQFQTNFTMTVVMKLQIILIHMLRESIQKRNPNYPKSL